MSRFTKLITLGVAVMAFTVGGSTLASASVRHKGHHGATHHKRHARTATGSTDPNTSGSAESSEGTSGSSEGDSDDAAQAAACTKAGIDPNASNVQYDDQTGTCSLDSGANNGGTDNGGGQ